MKIEKVISDNIPYPYYVTALDGQITKFNESFLTLINQNSLRNIAGLEKDFFTVTIKEYTQEDIQSQLIDKGRASFDAVMTFKNGHKKEVHFHKKIYPFPMIEESVVINYLLDNTEYALINNMMNKFSMIIENAPASIIITDINKNIEYVNSRYLNHINKSFSEIAGKQYNLLQERSDIFYNKNDLDKLLSEGKSWKGEVKETITDGSDVWKIVSISPVMNDYSQIINLAIVEEDITNQKIIENDLNISREKLNTLIDAIPDVMFRINSKGELLDDLLFDKIISVFPTDIAKLSQPLIDKAFITKEIQIMEYPVYYKHDLNYYEARFIISGSDELVVIVRNISDRVRTEEQLKKAKDDAESANRAKGDFLANMSHEIRTPLNGIIGFIDILSRTKLNKTQYEYFDIIKSSSKNLLNIINDILDFSKIERGKLEVDYVPFNFHQDIESSISIYNVKAAQKKINLFTYIDPLIPTTAVGDPLRIKQVMGNLISNAVKFTPNNQNIFISIELDTVSNDEYVILFSVKDSGIGIDNHKKKIIFEAFSQADTSVTRKYGGTGLGLSISLNLVKLMGGKLELDSEKGKGSNFFFKLKFEANSSRNLADKLKKHFTDCRAEFLINGVVSESEKIVIKYLSTVISLKITSVSDNIIEDNDRCVAFISKDNFALMKNGISIASKIVLVAESCDFDGIEYSSNIKILHHPMDLTKIISIINEMFNKPEIIVRENFRDKPKYNARILVAEDNVINQKLMQTMLNEIGIISDIAINGLDAYDKFLYRKYDCILMDINMPVCDGMESAKMIRDYESDNDMSHTPVIALTAKVFKDDISEIIESGIDGYISKPVILDDVVAELNKYLNPEMSDTLNPVADDVNDVDAISSTPPDDPDKLYYNVKDVSAKLGVPEDFLAELLPEYYQNFENIISLLSIAVEEFNFIEIENLSHKLKGMAGNLQFIKVFEILKNMEELSKNMENIDYRKLLDQAVSINDDYKSMILKK